MKNSLKRITGSILLITPFIGMTGCSLDKKTEKDYTAEQYVNIKDRCVKIATSFFSIRKDVYFDSHEQSYMCEIVLLNKNTKGYLSTIRFSEEELKTIIRYTSMVEAVKK